MSIRCAFLGHDWKELPLDNSRIEPWGLIGRRCRRCGVLSDHLRRTKNPNPPTTRSDIE